MTNKAVLNLLKYKNTTYLKYELLLFKNEF
jgi:hypothetical protein